MGLTHPCHTKQSKSARTALADTFSRDGAVDPALGHVPGTFILGLPSLWLRIRTSEQKRVSSWTAAIYRPIHGRGLEPMWVCCSFLDDKLWQFKSCWAIPSGASSCRRRKHRGGQLVGHQQFSHTSLIWSHKWANTSAEVKCLTKDCTAFPPKRSLGRRWK